MKSFKVMGCAVFALFIFFLSRKCFGEEVLLNVAPMEKTEQKALYSAIQGFVGNWWNGSDLYPDPCGWTPIQVPFFFQTYLPNYLLCRHTAAYPKNPRCFSTVLFIVTLKFSGKAFPSSIIFLMNFRRNLIATKIIFPTFFLFVVLVMYKD